MCMQYICCVPRRQLQPDGAEGRLCVGRAEPPRARGVVRLEGATHLLRFGHGVGDGDGFGEGWGARGGCTYSAYAVHMQSTHRRLEARPHLIDRRWPRLMPRLRPATRRRPRLNESCPLREVRLARLAAAPSRACARRSGVRGGREAQRGGTTGEPRARRRARHAERCGRGAALVAIAQLRLRRRESQGGGRGTLREPRGGRRVDQLHKRNLIEGEGRGVRDEGRGTRGEG